MQVYSISEHLITGLGCTTAENFQALAGGWPGLRKKTLPDLGDQAYYVSDVDRAALHKISAPLDLPPEFTHLETLLATSMAIAMRDLPCDPADTELLVIIASTKGNIDLLDQETPYPDDHPVHLRSTSRRIGGYFGFAKTPVILSHACTSGLMAVIMASRLLAAGRYTYAVVSGVDVIAPFTLSGFNALGAIDPEPCKPYDISRSGINLGEGCGTIILSSAEGTSEIVFTGGGISNDANHISGPSRTGAGLIQAARRAMREAGVSSVDYINAHGTATMFNDEMEAQAFHQLGLQDVPLNSLKGYWGHTLGAAGIIELIASIFSMRRDLLFASAGYQENGLTLPLNIIQESRETDVRSCLKTSSGFGGSNSALIVQKR